MKRFFDTNAILNADLSHENHFILSSITLEELEGIKTNRNKDEEIRYKARKAVHWLDENSDKYDVVVYTTHHEKILIDKHLDITNDNKIVACAWTSCISDEFVFVTDDICCKMIAKHVFSLNVESLAHTDDDYTGFTEIKMTDEQMAYFYEHQTENSFGVLVNEYLIIRNADNYIVDKLRWTGEKFEAIKSINLKSNYFGTVKPYSGDVYQQCVIDSLNNNQITMIKGPAGTGKSYLALGYLFYLLDKHKIDKIVMFVNPTPTANAAKLGFLPGTQAEKLIDSSVGNMLAGKLGDKYAIDDLMSRRKLDILPMCDIRGFDTTGLNCGVYITEAQNLDISLMKLALQRIGADSFCIVEGDYNAQVDLTQYAGNNNGMRRMSEVFRGHGFYGEVELQNIYRSKIAEIAELM